MTELELLSGLKKYIIDGDSATPNYRDILIQYKNEGGQQAMALEILTKFKLDHSGNEDIEERVNDILDIVVGWCSPHLKVWND